MCTTGKAITSVGLSLLLNFAMQKRKSREDLIWKSPVSPWKGSRPNAQNIDQYHYHEAINDITHKSLMVSVKLLSHLSV